jgi:hypothetical protein
MPVTKRVRFEVLRRDKHTCRYCRSTSGQLTIDHVIPQSLGGTDDPSNLVAACRDCNAGKTSSSPDEATVAEVATDALRWAAAMQAAVDRALTEREAGAEYLDELDNTWSSWGIGEGENRRPIPRDSSWEITAQRWRELGLPAAMVVDAMLIAFGNKKVSADDKWRYTCGVVWRKLPDLQTEALADLNAPSAQAEEEFVTEAPRWDLYLEGYRTARRQDATYPAYSLSQLSAVVDGPEAWVGTAD